MLWSGLISRCFLAAMYPIVEVSLRACAFMILSMLAVQPYWRNQNKFTSALLQVVGFPETITCDVTMQQGEDTSRLETTTFSIFLSRMSFITCTLRNVANWCWTSDGWYWNRMTRHYIILWEDNIIQIKRTLPYTAQRISPCPPQSSSFPPHLQAALAPPVAQTV